MCFPHGSSDSISTSVRNTHFHGRVCLWRLRFNMWWCAHMFSVWNSIPCCAQMPMFVTFYSCYYMLSCRVCFFGAKYNPCLDHRNQYCLVSMKQLIPDVFSKWILRQQSKINLIYTRSWTHILGTHQGNTNRFEHMCHLWKTYKPFLPATDRNLET